MDSGDIWILGRVILVGGVRLLVDVGGGELLGLVLVSLVVSLLSTIVVSDSTTLMVGLLLSTFPHNSCT